jgi:hypothetical protein
MNKQLEDLMYHAGLTAQGCWDEMDDYDRKAIEKFAELIVRQCAEIAGAAEPYKAEDLIKQHFGVKEC